MCWGIEPMIKICHFLFQMMPPFPFCFIGLEMTDSKKLGRNMDRLLTVRSVKFHHSVWASLFHLKLLELIIFHLWNDPVFSCGCVSDLRSKAPANQLSEPMHCWKPGSLWPVQLLLYFIKGHRLRSLTFSKSMTGIIWFVVGEFTKRWQC